MFTGTKLNMVIIATVLGGIISMLVVTLVAYVSWLDPFTVSHNHADFLLGVSTFIYLYLSVEF